MRWIVDRVTESAHVRGLIEGTTAHRITFFEAGPFCGKSTLMQHLHATARAGRSAAACVYIDFDDPTYARPLAIVDAFRAALGGDRLPETKSAMTRPFSIHAEASATKSTLESGAAVSAVVHYSGDNPVAAAARAALIEDLRQLKSHVAIFIDTFDKAVGTADSTWVGLLLHAIEYNPKLALVLAGRAVPLTNLLAADSYRQFRLTPVRDVPQWEAWLVRVGGEPLLLAFQGHLDFCCQHPNPLELIPLMVLQHMRKIDPDFSF